MIWNEIECFYTVNVAFFCVFCIRWISLNSFIRRLARIAESPDLFEYLLLVLGDIPLETVNFQENRNKICVKLKLKLKLESK